MDSRGHDGQVGGRRDFRVQYACPLGEAREAEVTSRLLFQKLRRVDCQNVVSGRQLRLWLSIDECCIDKSCCRQISLL